MTEQSAYNEAAPLDLKIGAIDREGLDVVEGGGVVSALGFSAAGVHAGFRKDPNRLDMALVVADDPCACAATFTQNVFCAAPVIVSRENLDGVSYGTARAVVVNSGVANAATGSRGIEAARRSGAGLVVAVTAEYDADFLASLPGVGLVIPDYRDLAALLGRF